MPPSMGSGPERYQKCFGTVTWGAFHQGQTLIIQGNGDTEPETFWHILHVPTQYDSASPF